MKVFEVSSCFNYTLRRNRYECIDIYTVRCIEVLGFEYKMVFTGVEGVSVFVYN